MNSCQANIDNNINKNTKDFLVINRIIKNQKVFQGIFEEKNNVILKLGEDNFKIDKEYDISKYLYEKGYDNFVNFICKFSCKDNISKYSQIDKNIFVCDSDGKVKITALLMNNYELGSIKNYKWTIDNVEILKELLIKSANILLKVSKETGFIHKDFHLDNIMISKDIFGNFIQIIIDLELAVFVNNQEIHKDYIYREDGKPIEKLLAIYDFKN